MLITQRSQVPRHQYVGGSAEDLVAENPAQVSNWACDF